MANNLSIDAYDIIVGGTFTFWPSTDEVIDSMLVKNGGTVNIDSQVLFRGRSADNTDRIEVIGLMILDRLVSQRGRDTWSGNRGSEFHLDHLEISGTLNAGLLSVAGGLLTFTVSETGVVNLQPTGVYNIEQTNIAGHVTSYTAFNADFSLFTGVTLVVSTGGILDMDYQGPRLSPGQGAENSTLNVNNIRIDGTWLAGSLDVVSDDFVVGNGGVVQVVGGGHFSDEGPGEMPSILYNFL